MKIILWAIALLGLLQITPLVLSWWQFDGKKLIRSDGLAMESSSTALMNSQSADLDGNGNRECIQLLGATAQITDCMKHVLWQSPTGWQVRQAFVSDLNRDGKPEATLLVWKPFTSWPIDSFLPNGGRINGFHDAQGLSCHLILIGWAGNGFAEKWAGSALIRPVEQLTAVDLDGDGEQELVGLEGEYDSPRSGGTLTVWRWRGFGFVLVDEVKSWFASIQVVNDAGNRWIVAQ
jgi:hypothetical protein